MEMGKKPYSEIHQNSHEVRRQRKNSVVNTYSVVRDGQTVYFSHFAIMR